jgi:cell division septation protein DedD
LEKNDVKGKIKRGARKVADKTKQGANWLRGKWLEADFGDGTGRAKFFADGGGVEIGSTFESENDSLNTFKGYNNYFCIEFNGKVLHSVKTKSQHLKKLNELVDKYNLTEIKQKNSEFDDGGGVHTMPNGEVMLNSAHYKNGGGVMSDGRFKLRGFPPIDKFELMELYYDFQENFSSNIEKFTKHYNKVHDSKLRLIDVKELFDYAKLTFEPNGSKFDNGGYIKQDSWTNSGMSNLSVKETKQIAEKYAQALSTLYNQEFSVNPSVEENSFDLDIDGMAYEGGSYLIYGDGSVVNVAVNPNSRLGSTKSSINEIIGKIIDLKNQYGNAQFETLKRADGSVYGRKISSEIKYDDGGEVGNYELLKKIKKEFGNPPKGSDIRALKKGIVEVFYYSPNEDAKNWAMKVKNKFGFGRLPSSIQYNSAIIYVDTFKMADGGVSYEPMTKPVPTTKPKERTKPDKDSPYKPKGTPKPKASYDTGGAVDDYIAQQESEFSSDEYKMRKQYRGDYRDIEYQGFLAIDESLTPNERLSDYEFEGEEFSKENLLEVAKKYPQADYITFHARIMGDNEWGMEDEGLSPIDDLAMSFDMAKLNQFADGGGVWDKMTDEERKEYEKGKYIHYNIMNSRWQVWNGNESEEFWNQEQAEKFAGFEYDQDKDVRYSRNKYQYLSNGGGVDSKAEKLANTIRKDYQNGVVVQVNNDYGDSAYFSISAPFEYSLSKETAKEINKKYFNGKGEISGGGNEHYLNVNFDLDNFADGGVSYEPMTKPVPTTKPKTPTKPDKDNPYKPKGIPKPKATKM